MSKTAERDEDIKPDEMELKYREQIYKQSQNSRFSQASTFKCKTDRTVKCDVFGIESDVKFAIKKEPTDNNGKTSVCICQINLNLQKP